MPGTPASDKLVSGECRIFAAQVLKQYPQMRAMVK
jgi:hypothetical protein